MLKGVASEWRQGYQDEAKGTEHGEAELKEQPEMKKDPQVGSMHGLTTEVCKICRACV